MLAFNSFQAKSVGHSKCYGVVVIGQDRAFAWRGSVGSTRSSATQTNEGDPSLVSTSISYYARTADRFGQLVADRFVTACNSDPYLDARYYPIDQFDIGWFEWAFADVPQISPQPYDSLVDGQCVQVRYRTVYTSYYV